MDKKDDYGFHDEYSTKVIRKISNYENIRPQEKDYEKYTTENPRRIIIRGKISVDKNKDQD